MKFHILTYLFEIVNFFVLLWILKKLLYNPVISVLKRRKEMIDQKIREAEEAERRAEEIRKEYEKLASELEETKKRKLAEITREIQEEKERLSEQMKEELDAQRRKFIESLEAERRDVLREIREEVLKTSRLFVSKLLSELIDKNMHEKLLSIALESLRRLSREEVKNLTEELSEHRVVTVESAFPLSEEEVNRVKNTLAKTFGVEVDIRTEVKRDLMAGVRLHVASKMIDASIEGQLQVFENLLRERVES